MLIPEFSEDVEIITALSDLPNDADGLTAAQFKAKFDAAAVLMKAYLNDTLVPQLTAATTGNLTYYVRTDGSDSNTGLANNAGGAFLTISKAISMIPQIVNHAVEILVADGTYAEVVTIEGFVGKGTFTIRGNNSTPESVSVTRFVMTSNFAKVVIIGFIASSTSEAGFLIGYCNNFKLSYCHVTATSATFYGVWAIQSKGVIELTTISNRSAAIYCTSLSQVQSFFNPGTGNTIGLFVASSFIHKVSAQPAGTTAESINGGEIYG